MKPPFFAVYGQDVIVCRSLESLVNYVEPPDVAEVRSYDSTGRVVELRAYPNKPQRQPRFLRWLLEPSLVTRAFPTSKSEPDALEVALKRFLGSVDPEIESLTPKEIVANLDRYGVKYGG